MANFEEIYQKKIGNATYEQLSQFIRFEISKGMKVFRKELEELKKYEIEVNDEESVEHFKSLVLNTEEAKKLHEITRMYLAAGYSLTKAFDEAKMLVVKLKS